jgi:hypothetical protein
LPDRLIKKHSVKQIKSYAQSTNPVYTRIQPNSSLSSFDLNHGQCCSELWNSWFWNQNIQISEFCAQNLTSWSHFLDRDSDLDSSIINQRLSPSHISSFSWIQLLWFTVKPNSNIRMVKRLQCEIQGLIRTKVQPHRESRVHSFNLCRIPDKVWFTGMAETWIRNFMWMEVSNR